MTAVIIFPFYSGGNRREFVHGQVALNEIACRRALKVHPAHPAELLRLQGRKTPRDQGAWSGALRIKLASFAIISALA